MNNKAQQKRLAKDDKKEKTRCPFCSAPLIDELGTKKCLNPSCTFKEEKKIKQEQILKEL